MPRIQRSSFRRARPVFALAPIAFAAAVSAQGLPTGGQVVAGRGSIAVNGSGLVVTQNSQRLVADWTGFSIGADRSVRFVQPSSSSVALNRVTGDDPSRILGTLSANGHVYLQNPNGVLFGAGARVNVGSLVATTLNTDVDDFLDGRLRMSGAEGAGEVRNDGTIRVAPGGHAVLAGPRVTNTGRIEAPGGSVALAAGAAVEVDATGAGLLSVRVPVAAVQAHLANRGTLAADGGEVQLRAAAADAALGTVMQVDGVVRARSVEQRDGRIVLAGGGSGVVRVGGVIDARGGAGQDGGTVQLRGERIALAPGARIDASGGTGGGTVTVGGNWQGRGGGDARDVLVAEGASIDASARDFGDAGTVVVWADDRTRFAGAIDARGGAHGGDGGRVEVSGKGWLGFEGEVDTRAAHGARGTLLLDPQTLIVGNAPNINGDTIPGDDFGPGFNPLNDTLFGAVTSQITATSVASLLATTSVTLQATSLLQVTSPVVVPVGGAATTLTLNAPVMDINSNLTLNNTALVASTRANTGDSISVNATISSLRSVTLTASTIDMDAGIVTPTLTFAVPAGAVGATITQTGGSIGATTLNITRGAGATSTVDLSSGSNQWRTINVVANSASIGVGNAAGTGLVVNASGNLALAGDGGGDVVVTAGGVFSLAGDLAGDDISITSAGFVNGSSGLLLPSAGNRFLIRSSDWTQDALGTIAPGTGATNVNFVVYAGFGGAVPAAGNGYVTNRTAGITAPNGDAPDISRVYDGTRGFAYVQTGGAAVVSGQDTSGGAVTLDTLTGYTVTSTGTFANKNAGTDKAYTVAGTNDVVGTGTNGVTYYGLRFAGYSRAAGPLAPGAPGSVVSEVTPRTLTLTGLDGVDRVYDGTTVVALDTTGVTLAGLVTGDAVALATGASGRIADKNVGTDKAVTVTGLGLSGADAGNYQLVNASEPTATITRLALTASGIRAFDKVFDGSTAVTIDASGATVAGVVAGDVVTLDASGASGAVATPDAGAGKTVTVSGLVLGGADAGNYSVLATPVTAQGTPLAVRILTPAQAAFEEIRYKAYLQGVSDAQEPFRRAMAEALAAGFGRENIRKPLSRGLVFETGLAAPAVDRIEPAKAPAGCSAAGAGLVCRP